MDGKTYEELLQDVAWEMGKRFGEKGEAVFQSYVFPPQGIDFAIKVSDETSVTNVHDKTGIALGEIDQFYLSLIKEAEFRVRRARHNLEKAVQIMREMRRANDGK